MKKLLIVLCWNKEAKAKTAAEEKIMVELPNIVIASYLWLLLLHVLAQVFASYFTCLFLFPLGISLPLPIFANFVSDVCEVRVCEVRHAKYCKQWRSQDVEYNRANVLREHPLIPVQKEIS